MPADPDVTALAQDARESVGELDRLAACESDDFRAVVFASAAIRMDALLALVERLQRERDEATDCLEGLEGERNEAVAERDAFAVASRDERAAKRRVLRNALSLRKERDRLRDALERITDVGSGIPDWRAMANCAPAVRREKP